MWARRFAALVVLCTLSGCRDHLALPIEPLTVDSVALSQPDAVQGETGIGVTVRIANDSAFRQRIDGVTLSVSVGGQDRTGDYSFAANPGNATAIEPASTVDLAFTMTVDDTATAGAATVDAVAIGAGGPGSPATLPASLQVLLHAQLEVLSQSVDGATCRNGRVALLRARVRNTGESTATIGAASATILRDDIDVSAEFLLTPSAGNPTTLAPGAETDIDMLVASDALSALGPIDAFVTAPASDVRSAVDASAQGTSTVVDVHQPAALFVTNVAETRVTVSKGQTALAVTATVANVGSVDAAIQTGALAFSIGGVNRDADYTVTPPSFGTVAAGASSDILFTAAVKSTAVSGATVIGATFAALDAVCDGTPSSAPALMTGAWTVQSPPLLAATVTNAVTQAWAGEVTTVSLVVQNNGEATANAVAPAIAVALCPTCAALTAVDTGAKNIAGGGSAMYQWTAALSVPLPSGTDTGLPRFDASGTGTDANTAGTVSSGTSSSVSTTVEARRPVACYTFSPSATPAGGANPFSVDASCSSDVETPDASLTYSWDWTGDGIFDDTGMTQTHDYGVAAKNTAVLRVTDAHGRQSTTSHTLVVDDNAGFGCVTTAVDEEDPGATPASPGGVGFSLRESINWAAGVVGQETVCFDAGLAGQTITFTRGVLPILPSGGIQLVGRADVVIDFGALPYGFRTRTDSEFHNLRLTGVAAGGIAKIIVGGTSVDIEECEIFGGGGAGIAWDATLSTGPGTDLDILDNDIHDNETDGIRIAPLIANDIEAEILRNRVWSNGASGIDVSAIGLQTAIGRNLIHGNVSHGLLVGADDGDIVNNTIALNGGDGIRFLDCGCGTNNRFWNNIVFDNTGHGLRQIGAGKGDSDGKNFVFGNDMGQILGADINTQGDDEIGSLDPLLEADFELARTSPCRDFGRNSGGTPDANGADTGLFYGTAFDIGAWESPR